MLIFGLLAGFPGSGPPPTPNPVPVPPVGIPSYFRSVRVFNQYDQQIKALPAVVTLRTRG